MEFIHKLKAIEKMLINNKILQGLIEISKLIDKCIVIKQNKNSSNHQEIPINQTEISLRIYTFGNFTMVLNGKTIIFQKKIQKRPLDLLKAIIVNGNTEVSKSRLATLL